MAMDGWLVYYSDVYNVPQITWFGSACLRDDRDVFLQFMVLHPGCCFDGCERCDLETFKKHKILEFK